MIRTRFAPSPTGFMHLGNLRTALYAYLFAKNNKGTFMLRVEDTDQGRLVEGSLEAIYQGLATAGIVYTEGPNVGGAYGPYIQSERREIYKEHALALIKKGGAYFCFCKKSEEVVEAAEEQDRKPHRCDCKTLDQAEIDTRLKSEESVIRQIIPAGTTTFTDEVFGQITVENDTLEEGVLLKGDGLPTYNFANVVDDHLMAITHVIRGTEYLTSSPKYNILYNAFGWDIPKYIHLPLILNESKEKLSKRKGDAGFEDLLAAGFLPEAIVNYIALLGWSPATNQEMFTLKALEDAFSLSGVSKSPSVFDRVKLTWFNGEYIKAMDETTYFEQVKPYLEASIKTPVDLKKVAHYTQSRVNFIKEAVELVDFIDVLPDYDISLYTHKKMKTNSENSLTALRAILPELKALQPFNLESVKEMIDKKVAELEVKNALILWPIRTAVSGKPTSFCGAAELIELLGQVESIRRIEKGIEKLQA